MKTTSISRQLTLLLLALSGVAIVVAVLLTGLQRKTMSATQQATAKATSQIGRAYLLAEGLSRQQANVQTLLRQKDPDEMEKLVLAAEQGRKELTKLIDDCGAAGQAMKGRLQEFFASQGATSELFLQGNLAGAYEKLMGEVNPAAEALAAEVDRYRKTAEHAVTTELAASRQQSNRYSLTVLVLSAVLLLGAVAYGWNVRRSLTRNLSRLSSQLSEAADQTAAAAAQVSSSSHSLAEGASSQAASLEETSASLEEMASMTQRNADNARVAKDLGGQTRQAAEVGAADMDEMTKAMAEIQAASSNISKILRTIDEIAFQTNILALNAAVEAARAGEAGMGFAVVADEVRNLAQRSAEAAKETAARIEDSIQKSNRGTQISGKVAVSLAEIVAKAREVDNLMAEIATASQEQSQGITQVNSAVSAMDRVTQANAASAEESASAAEELNAQSQNLQAVVSQLQQLVDGSARTTSPQPATAKTPKARSLRSAPTTEFTPAPETPEPEGEAPAGTVGSEQPETVATPRGNSRADW